MKEGFNVWQTKRVFLRSVFFDHLSTWENHKWPQSRYLARICDNPGISQEELAQYYQIDKGAIAKSVRRMGELGYVKREQNPEDRRAYCLFPTERAREVMDFCREDMKRMEQAFEESLTPEEIETFQRLLLRITDNMQKYIEEDKS